MSNHPISAQTVLEQLSWRYATKQFDPSKKVSESDWSVLEQALVLTPSSFGLQPWKFIIVKDQAVRESLVAHSWGQRQVADASHLVVLAIKKEVTIELIDALINRTVELRGGTAEALAGYKGMMVNMLLPHPQEALSQWAAKQVYIALGNLMTAAAMMGIDTCPMEGFDAAKYDEILGLEARGVKSCVVCPVGYRAETDKYASLAKVRFKAEDLIETI